MNRSTLVWLAAAAAFVAGVALGVGWSYHNVEAMRVELLVAEAEARHHETRVEQALAACAEVDGVHARLDALEGEAGAATRALVAMREDCVVPGMWHELGVVQLPRLR